MTNAVLPPQNGQTPQQPSKQFPFVQIQVGPESGSVVGLDTLPSYRGRPTFQMLPSVPPAVRSLGSEADRAARTDVMPLLIDSGHLGFKADSSVLAYGQYKNAYRTNTGIYGTWLPGKGVKAFKPVIQADLISADFSAYEANPVRQRRRTLRRAPGGRGGVRLDDDAGGMVRQDGRVQVPSADVDRRPLHHRGIVARHLLRRRCRLWLERCAVPGRVGRVQGAVEEPL